EISVAHLNIRSIVDINKFVEFTHLVINSYCDVFSISETWLTDYNASLYNISGYNFFSIQSKHKSRGSGVVCYVRDCWSVNMLDLKIGLSTLECKAIEYLAIEVSNANRKYVILTIYRPHASLRECVSALDKILFSFSESRSSVSLMGDFNFNFTAPLPDGSLMNSLTAFDLKMCSNIPTR